MHFQLTVCLCLHFSLIFPTLSSHCIYVFIVFHSQIFADWFNVYLKPSVCFSKIKFCYPHRMTESDPKFGITGPVTYKESTAEEIEMTKQMENYLRESEFFESEDAAQTRERVLGKLNFMLKKFVGETSCEKDCKKYGGKIFTFGSYRLGVHDKGADIDVLCVVPRHVTRKDFFTIFYEDLSKDENVSELSKVEEAYAPLIKLKFHGIPIDMTFARLNLPVVKESTTLLNDNILKSMDEKCITSLNGSRVTDAMLHLVPNVEAFHSALRAIKFWAKRRCIYGNTYGYFGGVAYSISVARICQMYPNATAYEVVAKYFEVYSTWKWPAPVQLCPIIDHNYNMKVWDPKVNPADKYHRMPIITPVYPSRCATHNVTQSTFNNICAELHRGYDKIKAKAPFSKLFEASNFFKNHKMFVEVAINCDSQEEFNMWEGYIESKVRILSSKLENLECIVAAIPFPKAFRGLPKSDSEIQINQVTNCENTASNLSSDDINEKKVKLENLEAPHTKKEYSKFSAWFYIAIDVFISVGSSRKFYIGEPIDDFLQFVNCWEFKTAGMKIEINSKKKKDVLSLDFINDLSI